MSTAIVLYRGDKIIPYYRLVEEDIKFMSRDEVKQKLPDILGKALARSWIDDGYKEELKQDIKWTLERGGVTLPEEYDCVYEKTGGKTAKIIVYEQQPGSKFKLRVCGFTLTMMATR